MEIVSFGAHESPQDYRDISLSSVVEPVTLPLSFSVDVSMLPVENQRQIGACVGHAGAKYKQKLDQKDTGRVIPESPRFLYAVCKCLDGILSQGTYPRTSMKVLMDYGCATTDTVPNDTTLDHETYVYNRNLNNIPSEAFKDAETQKIGGYASVDITLDGIQSAVFQSSGCSMLVRVGKEWYTDKNGLITWNADSILPIKPPAVIISGHEIYVYGYETVGEDMKIFFINSWSGDWASAGKGWFWWSEYKNFIVEAWTAVDIKNEVLEQVQNLPAPSTFKYNFRNVILYGQRDEDVKNLQIALKIEGLFRYPEITGYYGDISAEAVLAFQKKYNVASWLELSLLKGRRAGKKTLLKLNQLYNVGKN